MTRTNAAYSDPYPITDPKHPESVESLEERTEQV